MYFLHSSNRSLLPLLDRWGLHCQSVALETFYSPTHYEEEVEGEEQEGKGVCPSAQDCVIIDGLSKNILSSNHTIYMWDIGLSGS